MMKNTILFCILLLGLCPVFAQSDPGVLTISGQQYYAQGRDIAVTANYLVVDLAGAEISDYTWELRTIDEDGNPGEILYSQSGQGDPSGEFHLPESVVDDLTSATNYKLSLGGMTADGLALSSQADMYFTVTDISLNAADHMCCFDGVWASVDFGLNAVSANCGHRWVLTPCDASGTTTGTPIPNTGAIIPGFPDLGPYMIQNSNDASAGMQCDQYYRIDFYFYDDVNIGVPTVTSKVVYVSNYILTAKDSYCEGTPVYASGQVCAGASTGVYYHGWALRDYDPATQQASTTILYQQGLNGAPGSNYIFPPAHFTAGQYYQIELIFFDINSVEIPGSRRKKVIYIAPIFQPVISGTSPACGTGTYNVTNVPAAANYTYQWVQQEKNLTTTNIPGSSTSSSVTIPFPSYFSQVGVYVTTNYGCKNPSPQFLDVNNSHEDLGFSVILEPYAGSPTTYKIRIQRWYHARPDTFTVEIVTSAGGNTYTPAFSAINNSRFTNLKWGSGSVTPSSSTPFYLYNYHGNSFGYLNSTHDNTTNVSNPAEQGIFYNDTIYRITQRKDVAGCPTAMYSLVLDKAGIRCPNCRTAIPQGEDDNPSGEIDLRKGITTANNNTLQAEVFPNPNNGTFRIRLQGATENTKAEMVDMTGRVVDAFTINSNDYQYNPSQKLAGGTYILHISNNGSNHNSIVVIE